MHLITNAIQCVFKTSFERKEGIENGRDTINTIRFVGDKLIMVKRTNGLQTLLDAVNSECI